MDKPNGAQTNLTGAAKQQYGASAAGSASATSPSTSTATVRPKKIELPYNPQRLGSDSPAVSPGETKLRATERSQQIGSTFLDVLNAIEASYDGHSKDRRQALRRSSTESSSGTTGTNLGSPR